MVEPLGEAARLTHLPGYWAGYAGALLDAGDTEAAEREYVRLRSRVLVRDMTWPTSQYRLALLAARLGDADSARGRYTALLPYSGRAIVVGMGVATFGPVDVALAEAARAFGDHDAARQHAQRAAELAPDSPFLARLTTTTAGPRRPTARQRARLGASGDHWVLEREAQTWVFPDLRGLRHLAHLLDARGTEVHVLELSARPRALDDPALDATALAHYRARLRELQGEIDAADAAADLHRAERARTEFDAITTELTAALGLGGRRRASGPSEAERARSAVTKALRAALTRIERADPETGRHLRVTVRTGAFCSYDPGLDPALELELAPAR
jgi:tetratricopeptide (TPR) repeat protein